jgi:hypothetical protein
VCKSRGFTVGIEPAPTTLAPLFDTLCEIDWVMGCEDRRGTFRHVVRSMHRDEHSTTTHALRIIMRLFLRHAYIGEGADETPSSGTNPYTNKGCKKPF